METLQKHIVWLDTVRLFAMFTVVCCHCSDPFNFYQGTPPPDIEDIKFWGAAYGAFLRPCVPLFVMLTGALLLPVKESNTSLFYKKRIGRVLWPFLIWSILYNLFPWITGLLGCKPDIMLSFFPYSGEEAMQQSFTVSLGYIAGIPLNFSVIGVHMWYIYLLIGLYLYMPIFSAWVEKASRKAQLYFLIAWGITTLIPYYHYYGSPYLWGECSWNSYGMLYYFAGFNGYLLLGHYLRNTEWTTVKTLFISIPLFLVGYVVTFLGFRHITSQSEYSPEDLEMFFLYNSLNVVMMTIACFMLIKKIKVTNRTLQKMLANLTVCGFGIYMIHYFFTTPCVLLMRELDIPLCMQIPCAAIIAFAISWLLIAIIHRYTGKRAVIFVG